MDLIATCALGLETLVRHELASLGIEAAVTEPGRVSFQGTHETIGSSNLWLRTADRVLIRLASFPAADFDALFESTRQIPWGEWIPETGEFPVTGRCIRSTLSSLPACQRSIKRAVVDALMRDHGCGNLSETGPRYRIDFTILKDLATLTIDTSGAGLSRRGFHAAHSSPQIKETLAAAMVMLSFWKSGRPMIDPFCGGGTIAIEAARLGRNIAPGRDREFACEGWPDFPANLFPSLRQAADDALLGPLETKILASDIDARAVRAARECAAQARVAHDIHFEVRAAQDAHSQRRFGCLITRPPDHGGVEGDRELEETYRTLPDVFRKLPTWSHYVLTAFPHFEEIVGRQADRRRKLYNGRVASTYYQFHGPKPVTNPSQPVRDPESPSAAVSVEASDTLEAGDTPSVPSAPANRAERIEHTESAEPAKRYEHAAGPAAFGELSAKALEQSELFAVRLRKRAKHLRRWPTKRGITCYRLYERDIPEIPLVVDLYENYLHITEFERPHERTPAEHGNWLDLMAETARKALDIDKGNVYLKRRSRQRGTTQHGKLAETHQRIEVHEGSLRFLVNLADYVDTGLFLDHRQTRQMVREAAEGKDFLNLFCYTGSFTVYAAAGGAKRTVNVDLSRNYLDWAKDNLNLNGLGGPQHRFIASDVGRFIREHPRGEAYDLVVLDPPTFSNSKRSAQDWAVQEDANELLTLLMPLVRPGGVVFFSTNFRRFKFDPEAIPATLVHEITNQTIPEDYRNKRIHRCWKIIR